MQRRSRIFSAFCTTAAVTLLAGAATLNLQAQPSASVAVTQSPFSYTQPVAVESPACLASVATAEPALNYSSSAGAEETASAEGMSFGGDAAPQPPPRHYGPLPISADSSRNPDGSE